MWGIEFGAIGLGFTYSRKQQALVPLITRVALFIAPYLVSNIYLLVVSIGIILVLVPYFVKV